MGLANPGKRKGGDPEKDRRLDEVGSTWHRDYRTIVTCCVCV